MTRPHSITRLFFLDSSCIRSFGTGHIRMGSPTQGRQKFFVGFTGQDVNRLPFRRPCLQGYAHDTHGPRALDRMVAGGGPFLFPDPFRPHGISPDPHQAAGSRSRSWFSCPAAPLPGLRVRGFQAKAWACFPFFTRTAHFYPTAQGLSASISPRPPQATGMRSRSWFSCPAARFPACGFGTFLECGSALPAGSEGPVIRAISIKA